MAPLGTAAAIHTSPAIEADIDGTVLDKKGHWLPMHHGRCQATPSFRQCNLSQCPSQSFVDCIIPRFLQSLAHLCAGFQGNVTRFQASPLALWRFR